MEEYLKLQEKMISKLNAEFKKLNPDQTVEYQIKEAFIEHFKENKDDVLMHIDFLKVLYEKDNTLEYIYTASKDIPIARLINKASNGIITLSETLELIGDDAYIESKDKQRMTRIDGHAYFIRKPESIEDIAAYTEAYELRDSSQTSPYHVFKNIELDGIKYDDFVNRRLGYTHKFIADNANGCHENKYGILQCIRISNSDDPKQNILIQSEGYDYARYAAIERIPPENEYKKANSKRSKGVER